MNTMHRITLLTVGRLKEPWARAAAEQYAERINAHAQLRVVELAQSRARTGPEQQVEESQRLLAQLKGTSDRVLVLDERGKGMTSRDFATFIAEARDRGAPLTFILGGAYGLTDAVRAAGRTVRLSDMTLPHELCRVVFLEQLYRALEIGRGSGYHH